MESVDGRDEQPETSTEAPTAHVEEVVVNMEEGDRKEFRRTKSENRHKKQNSKRIFFET